ncbi:MAG: FAD-dependent oxidoreductase [Candidatus Bathyarchaeia archaeon]
MERVDAAVVGAGLAGLSCAYTLAKAGLDVLVVERGDYPGSKNVTGGRLYVNPVRQYLPEIWDHAPFERHITRERLTMLSDDTSVTMEFRPAAFDAKPYHSHTLLRPTFDRWLADQASAAGAAIVSKYKVESLLHENGRISGIRAEGEDIAANVVVAADGALSFIAEEARLRSRHNPEHFAVGLKETIELPQNVIEDRFNLHGEEGAAQLYFGSVTKGLTGGGFLYTNRQSISLGIVVGLGSLMASPQQPETYQLLEEFKQLPEISALISGGETVEYSAHTIPEGGIESLPKLFADGILAVGDAAGLALNMGIIVRGMDMAIASGAMAAETIKEAKRRNNYNAATLAAYETMLKNSFVLKDLKTFRNVWKVLNNPRLFEKYPRAIGALMLELMRIGPEPKPKLSSTALKHIRKNFFNLSTLKDILSLLTI